jgi:hypothetical protein
VRYLLLSPQSQVLTECERRVTTAPFFAIYGIQHRTPAVPTHTLYNHPFEDCTCYILVLFPSCESRSVLGVLSAGTISALM